MHVIYTSVKCQFKDTQAVNGVPKVFPIPTDCQIPFVVKCNLCLQHTLFKCKCNVAY